jgi:hypothetical protein
MPREPRHGVLGVGSSVDDLTGRNRSDVRTNSGIREWPVARVRRETLLLRVFAELYSSGAPSESWAQNLLEAGTLLPCWLAVAARLAGSWRPGGPAVRCSLVGSAVVVERSRLSPLPLVARRPSSPEVPG